MFISSTNNHSVQCRENMKSAIFVACTNNHSVRLECIFSIFLVCMGMNMNKNGYVGFHEAPVTLSKPKISREKVALDYSNS